VRYHKAIKIHGPEASYISSTLSASLNGSGVVGLNGKWYDVRSLTAEEVDAFLEDLLRADVASLEAERMTPH
jgi:hypothetical protein